MNQGDIEHMERINIKAVLGDSITKEDQIWFNDHLDEIKKHYYDEWVEWNKVNPFRVSQPEKK